MKIKEELKLYFKAQKKPTQAQFWEWLDSYWHKEEKISEESVEIFEKAVPRIIGDNMLVGIYLSITTPKHTKSIANGALAYDNKKNQIIEVNFNEGIEIIGMYSVYGQSIKHIKTPSTLKSIMSNAFESPQDYGGGNALLEKITLNEGLQSVGSDAFSSPKATLIKDLYIPNSVISVGTNAFAIPCLETVSAPAGLNLSQAGIPSTAIITFR